MILFRKFDLKSIAIWRKLETVTFDNISTHLPELDPKIIINRRDEFCNETKEYSRLMFTVFTYLTCLQRYGD